MLKRITHNKELIDKVAKLVRWHMEPAHFIMGGAHPPAYKRLAHRLAPDLNIAMLLKVATADRRGRNGSSSEPLTHEDQGLMLFAQKAADAQVAHDREAALLSGKDFLEHIAPGPKLGRAVERAYELQMDGETDKERLKHIVLKEML